MTVLTPYDVRMSSGGMPVPPSTNFSYTGSDWFGPLPPMQPVAPPEVAGRSWDFIPGYNLATRPRTYEPIDFATLRALADAYDPLRLVIERRKDQLMRLPWTIRPKHDGSKRRPKKVDLPAATRARIDDVTALFKRPTYEMTFSSWFRAILEDLFVIDAPTLFRERNYRGALVGLRPIAGDTIKRVIDDWGNTPRPVVWGGRPFMWDGVEITMENYATQGFKLVGGFMFPPAFQQILKGLPAVDYTTHDLIYRPANLRPGQVYGKSPVEQVVTTVNIAMRRAHHQLEYYREGNQPEAIYSLPESYTPNQIQQFQDYWDNLFIGHLGRRRQMRFIAGGGKQAYTPLKEPPLKSEFDEWLVRIICFAFSYPPTALVALSNRSIAEQHVHTSEEEGLQPTKQWAAELFNDVIENDLGADDVEFAWAEEDEIDQSKQATILATYTDSGILTRNEARERLGEEPSPEPAADVLMVKTATGCVPISSAAVIEKSLMNSMSTELRKI